MTPFEIFLRANMEVLTYIVFFGLLVGLGTLEFIFELRAEGANRGRRWPSNFGLTVLNIVVLGAIPVTALVAADLARSSGYGLFNRLELPFAITLVAGFLARSLVSWLIHYAMHNIPLLWRIHRVHHTDTHLDVSTTVRFHPLEFIVSAPLVIGTVLVLGLPPVVVMLFELFDAAIAVFSHANVRLSRWLERGLSVVIITPGMHRIHHSTQAPETNSNYGATLSLWDRMFGTFRQKEADALARQPLGLEETQDARAWSFLYMLTLPFRALKLHPIRKPETTVARRSKDIVPADR